jgi:2'-hydroxyisoflavone reductase
VKLLVLGGTVFVGRHVVEAALSRHHDVTLFNRGRENPHLFPGIEKLRGDRDSDVGALRGRRFDAVIDLSGYTPAQVRATADALPDVAHYTFVSSVSAYRAYPPGETYDERAPRHDGHEGYGALKARAEDAIQTALPGRVAIVRAGLIVGPYDPTDRFTYWPRRVALGGDVLAPGRPERPVQFIDARDLAAWCVTLAEARTTGPFNATGYEPALTMGALLDACLVATGSDARFRWLDDDALLAAGVARWTEMPLWIPEREPRVGGMLLADTRRARAAGLTFRPLAETILDTLTWDRAEGAQPADKTARVTPITREREAAILATMPPTRTT